MQMKTLKKMRFSKNMRFWGTSIALKVYIREKERSKINYLEHYFRELKYV